MRESLFHYDIQFSIDLVAMIVMVIIHIIHKRIDTLITSDRISWHVPPSLCQYDAFA